MGHGWVNAIPRRPFFGGLLLSLAVSVALAAIFVAAMAFEVVGGKGAFTFNFHMANDGALQHAVQLYTDGTTECALFAGSAGTRSLFRPMNRVPALAGRTLLAIAVNGPSMQIYV